MAKQPLIISGIPDPLRVLRRFIAASYFCQPGSIRFSSSFPLSRYWLVVKHADTKLLSAVFHIFDFVSACFTTSECAVPADGYLVMGEAAVNYWITAVPDGGGGGIKGEIKKELPPDGGSTL